MNQPIEKKLLGEVTNGLVNRIRWSGEALRTLSKCSKRFDGLHPRLRVLLLCGLLVPGSAWAAAPVLKSLEPPGGQRGQALKVTLVGDYLDAAGGIITTLPGTFSRLVASPEQGARELPWLLQLKSDAAPGLYPVRIQTEDGLSNILLFSVGLLPETVEAESLLKERDPLDPLTRKLTNDSTASAERVAVPITVNGTLVGPDQDYYRFSAKAGEKLVFEVDARRAGSAIDPVLQVFDSTGKELAVSNDAEGAGVDARVEVAFAQAGEYLALVHDAKYSDQEQNFYRLKIGSYPYADSLFPLGWQRNKPVEISFRGGNLPAPTKISQTPGGAGDDAYAMIGVPGSDSLPFLFRLGDLPELIEPSEQGSPAKMPGNAGGVKGPVRSAAAPPARNAEEIVDLPASTVMNGRISRVGEIDRYRVKVTPGQHWAFEVEAAALETSKLLGVLSIYDAATKKRLALTELGPEVGANPYSFDSSRNEVDPRLSLDIPADVKAVIVAVEDLLGRGGPDFAYRLSAFPSPPDFTVELTTPYINLPLGGSAAVEVLVGRRGYDGPIQLSIPDLPEGVVAEGGHVPAEMNPPEDRRAFAPGYLTLTIQPEAKVRSFPLTVWAESVGSTPAIRRQAVAPGMIQLVRGTRQKSFKAPWLNAGLPAAIAKPTPYQLELGTRHIRIVQGGDYALAWKLVKPAQNSGPVKIEYPKPLASIKDLRVLKRPEGMEYLEEGTFHVLSTFSTPPVTFDLVLGASRIVGGKSEPVLTAPAVTVEIVPGYQIKLLSQTLESPSGGKIELAGKIEREPGFRSNIKIELEDLPEHVDCQPVVVPAEESTFRLLVDVKPEARPGRFALRVSSVATILDRNDQQEFKAPDVKAEMVVLAGSRAAK